MTSWYAELFRLRLLIVAAQIEMTRLENSTSRVASPSANRCRKVARWRIGLTEWISWNQSSIICAMTSGGPSRSRPHAVGDCSAGDIERLDVVFARSRL
jgi:hypothetical protein